MERRRFLSTIIGTASVALAGCAAFSGGDGVLFEGDADRWPRPLHDPANTGRNPAANGPREGMERDWVYEFDADVDGFFGEYSAPVVDEGDVYVVERWERRFDDENGEDAAHTHLLSIDDTGAKRWVEGMRGENGVRLTRYGLAFDENELVSATTLRQSDITPWIEDGLFEITRRDPETGDQIDHSALDELWGPPMLADDRYFAVGREEIVEIDGAGLDVERRYEDGGETDDDSDHFHGGIGFPPSVVEGTVYVNGSDRLFAIEPNANEPSWTIDAHEDLDDLWGEDVLGSFFAPAVDADLVYTTFGVPNPPWNNGDPDRSPERNGGVVAVDRNDGTIVWTWQQDVDDDWAGTAGCSPAIDEAHVYVCGYSGVDGESVDERLYALDRADGELIWEQPIDGFAWAPVAGKETVYVVSYDEVAAFDASSGDRLASDSLDEYTADRAVPPAVVDGKLVVSTKTAVITYTA